MLGEIVPIILQYIVGPAVILLLGIILGVILYRNPSTRKLILQTHIFTLESEKHRDLIKHPNQVTKLKILGKKEEELNGPYLLTHGSHQFTCVATYADGTEQPFAAHWLCWPRGSRDGTEVLGTKRQKTVRINSSKNHEKYTELSCWVYPPSKTESNANNPSAALGFRYPAD